VLYTVSDNVSDNHRETNVGIFIQIFKFLIQEQGVVQCENLCLAIAEGLKRLSVVFKKDTKLITIIRLSST